MSLAPRHWFDMTPDQRVEAVVAAGWPAYRASQISAHVFDRGEADPSAFTDLPAGLREQVSQLWFPRLLSPVDVQRADGGRTVKTAWRLADGAVIESVVMRYPRRDTVCISSQAGCGMGCPFCATGLGGLTRNLSSAEIVDQVFQARSALSSGQLPGGAGRVDNVVLMGMGEPMANYQRVLAAVRQIVTSCGISARSVTISTVGLVPGMAALAREGLPVTLALSLHAPDDDLRNQLVPMNQRYPVAQVLDAAWQYAKATKRRVSIEYALMRDINDQPARADELAAQLRARGDWTWAHVNVIPLNPAPGSPWTAATPARQAQFVARVAAGGVPVTVRDTRGRSIDGACGQLSARVSRSADTIAKS